MTPVKWVHFVGIAGVGMSALAIYCLERKIKVTGSDDGKEYITWKALKRAGLSWHNGFAASHVSKDIDLVVATNAHEGFTDNVETKEARRLKIPVFSLRQAIARFAQGFKIIAVAGTHGKTTTAAMISIILYKAGLDPSWVPIGTATVPNLPANGHAGKGEWFVTEADEYFDRPPELGGKPNFLYFSPDIAVITSVDWDHPDVYPTKKHYLNAFKKFVKQVKPGGLIVAFGDSGDLRKIAKSAQARTWWYGKKHLWSNLRLKIIGLHNELNATAAARVAHEVGVDQKNILSALSEFEGSERRLENKGEWHNVLLFDDYAHHPVEVSMTLEALRQSYPARRIVAAFQPHTFSRTEALLLEFSRSFKAADEVFILDIFGSAREKKGKISSADLARELDKQHPQVHYVPGEIETVAPKIKKVLESGDIFVTLGATQIYKLHDYFYSHG